MAVFKKLEDIKSTPTVSSRPEEIGQGKSLIGKTVFLKGELYSDEELVIEGKLEGKLKAKDIVIIGRNGNLTADVEAREIIVRGRINGNVKGAQKVTIEPEGVLNGDIIAQRVVLAEGAVFKGNIDMSVRDQAKTSVEKEPQDKDKEAKDKKPQVKTST
jgi:cytoskeletal protein CcmA (bactofilin family)